MLFFDIQWNDKYIKDHFVICSKVNDGSLPLVPIFLSQALNSSLYP